MIIETIVTKDQLIIQENIDHGFGGECGNVRFDLKCYFIKKLILIFCKGFEVK